MRLFRNGDGLHRAQAASAATIGGFDGMHCGHQAVFARLHEIAAAKKLPTTVILFEPLPHSFFHQNTAQRLVSLRDRLEFLQAAGVDQVVCLSFNQRLATRSAQEFIDDILVRGLKIRCLLTGDDFRFGKNREGNFALLQQTGQKYRFCVEQVPPFVQGERRVSSTWIREVLAAGDFTMAARLLGRAYTITGRVGYGDGRGRQLGFPTANLITGKYPLSLRGVFVGEVRDQSLSEAAPAKPCLLNAGYRPTFNKQIYRLEVHIMNFESDLYGHHLQVRPLKKLRDEKRFDNHAVLQANMRQDLEQAMEFWAVG